MSTEIIKTDKAPAPIGPVSYTHLLCLFSHFKVGINIPKGVNYYCFTLTFYKICSLTKAGGIKLFDGHLSVVIALKNKNKKAIGKQSL